jgi:tetratricopeptide (TPR) repeat protein
LLGGTLPYMAPEQIEALSGNPRTVDERSDLYALGIVLFELLTAAHPFPIHRAPVEELLTRMCADRLAPPPRPRARNESVTPAAESIILRCLQPDPERRYFSARELLDDLERQLKHRPLKHAPDRSLRERFGKWVKRHPRLCSSFSVATFSIVLLVALVAGFSVRLERLNRLEALQALRTVDDELGRAHALLASPESVAEERAEGLRLCSEAIARYQVLSSPTWRRSKLVSALDSKDRAKLMNDLGDLLMVWARAEAWSAEGGTSLPGASEPLGKAIALNQAAQSCFEASRAPQALWRQRARLERLAGRVARAEEAERIAASIPAKTAQEQFWRVADQIDSGRFRAAIELLTTAVKRNEISPTLWLILGDCYSRLSQLAEAADCYNIALALEPQVAWAHNFRGIVRLKQKDFARAADDFTDELRARPGQLEPRFNRAVARLAMKEFAGAIADFDAVLKSAHAPTRAYFARARARLLAGDRAGAQADSAHGLKLTPKDEESWIARAVARMATDPKGALADLEQALLLNPRSSAALETKAHVLSEKLHKPAEALSALDHNVAWHPDYVLALGGRGVVLARAGKREPAIADAQAALLLDREPSTLYQVACIFALTSRTEGGDRPRANALLASVFRADPTWLKVAATDHDLDPLRQDPEFQAILQAARALDRAAVTAGTPSK